MTIARKWTWAHTAVSIALLGGLLLLVVGKWGPWFGGHNNAPHPPSTANNLVLTIDSNLIRTQVIMENLVFAKDPAELAPQVKSVDLLTEAIDHDFQAMGEFFPADNAQFNRALSLFREWKSIREEVIGLTSADPPQAKKVVLGRSAAHVQKIRTALAKLESFSKKRGKDFESKAYEAYREEQRGQ